MTMMHTYNGYKLTVREDQTPAVSVFDPRYPRDPALYKATSLDDAMRWVDAYIKGEVWATPRHAAKGNPVTKTTKPSPYHETPAGAKRVATITPHTDAAIRVIGELKRQIAPHVDAGSTEASMMVAVVPSAMMEIARLKDAGHSSHEIVDAVASMITNIVASTAQSFAKQGEWKPLATAMMARIADNLIIALREDPTITAAADVRAGNA